VNRIACIGSRETPLPIREWVEDFGGKLVSAGYVLVSGNAPGADQAWARGGNRVDPARVELCLPWDGFEARAICAGNIMRPLRIVDIDGCVAREMAITAEMHPRWKQLSAAAQYLLSRNVMIVEGTRCVIGYADPHKKLGGGTGFAFNVARRFEIPCIDVASASERHKLECAMRDGKMDELLKVETHA
jgi:hypothetical protein